MLNENFIFGIKGLRPHCDLNNTQTIDFWRLNQIAERSHVDVWLSKGVANKLKTNKEL